MVPLLVSIVALFATDVLSVDWSSNLNCLDAAECKAHRRAHAVAVGLNASSVASHAEGSAAG